jgi:hypothetical protein
MSTNPFPNTPANITYEQVMAMLHETSAVVDKIGEKSKITADALAELSAESVGLKKVMIELGEQSKETDKQIKETGKQIKDVNKRMGELSNRFGELAEHLVAPGIARCFNELGYNFDICSPSGIKFIDPTTNQYIVQVDLLFENHTTIAAVEVKAKPKVEDVQDHVERIKTYCIERQKRIKEQKNVIGAIAGAIFPDNVKIATLKEGLFVITQSGDTVKINVPENFKPRIF